MLQTRCLHIQESAKRNNGKYKLTVICTIRQVCGCGFAAGSTDWHFVSILDVFATYWFLQPQHPCDKIQQTWNRAQNREFRQKPQLADNQQWDFRKIVKAIVLPRKSISFTLWKLSNYIIKSHISRCKSRHIPLPKWVKLIKFHPLWRLPRPFSSCFSSILHFPVKCHEKSFCHKKHVFSDKMIFIHRYKLRETKCPKDIRPAWQKANGYDGDAIQSS